MLTLFIYAFEKHFFRDSQTGLVRPANSFLWFRWGLVGSWTPPMLHELVNVSLPSQGTPSLNLAILNAAEVCKRSQTKMNISRRPRVSALSLFVSTNHLKAL